MPKILLIDDDKSFQTKLKKSFEELENEFSVAKPGDDGIKMYKEYGPDLVLVNYTHSQEYADVMFREILKFDSTACIVALLTDEHEDKVHQMYLKGVRSTIKTPKKLKTAKDVKAIMDQMFKVCDELKFENCVGCWKTGRFASTIKLN